MNFTEYKAKSLQIADECTAKANEHTRAYKRIGIAYAVAPIWGATALPFMGGVAIPFGILLLYFCYEAIKTQCKAQEAWDDFMKIRENVLNDLKQTEKELAEYDED